MESSRLSAERTGTTRRVATYLSVQPALALIFVFLRGQRAAG